MKIIPLISIAAVWGKVWPILIAILFFGLIISTVYVLFSKQILSFIGAEEKVLEYASQYLTIVGGFIFFQALLSSMHPRP